MKNWTVISFMLILSLLGGSFSINQMTCSNASSGAIWTRNAMTEYEPFSYLYLVYWKITKIIRFFVKTWFSELLLPLSSKPSIFKPSENIMVHFLNTLAQISPNSWSEQRQHDHVRFIKQRKPLYTSNGKVTQREREFCTLNCYLFTSNLATEEASLLLIYK